MNSLENKGLLRNKIITTLVLALQLFQLASQKDVEAQFFRLYEDYERHQYSNLDSAEYYAEKIYQLSLKQEDKVWMAAAYECKGYVYFYGENLMDAMEMFTLQKEILEELDDPGNLSLAYMNIANVQGGMALYDKSIQNYLTAERLLPADTEYDLDRAYLNYNLANTLLDFEDYDNAKKYLLKSEKYSKENELTDLYASITNMHTEILLQEKEYAKAREFADSGLLLSREHSDMIEEVYALELLARSELALGNVDKAILLQKESLRLSRIYGDPFLEVLALAVLAEIYLESGDVTNGLKAAKASYNMRDEQYSLVGKKHATKIYSRALEESGDHTQALMVLREFTAHQDSLYSTNLNESILEAQNKSFAETNKLLQEKSNLQNKIIGRNKIIGVILILSLVLAAISISVITVIVSRIRKANSKLQFQQEELDKKSGELEKANKQLEALNSGKDKLLSILTHDIKQPFNQTLGALEIISLYSKDNPQLADILGEVRSSVENDKKTVENLLLWSKSQFARITANPSEVSWHEITDKVMVELKSSIEEKKLKLDLSIDSNSKVFADPYHLEIILRNLLTNAVKFSHKGGELKLTAQRNDDTVVVELKDQGVGMSEQQLTSLFDLNKHFSEKGTLNEAGTGLGMLIVFDFVKENHGEIQVESEPSKGSIFRLRFPAA